ncbi:MAG: DUF3797 domain-containing protein [Clostridium sp.]
MEVLKLLKIMPKYEKCPKCGSSTIGNGQGGIIVEDGTFTRTCKCGFKITVDEDGKVIK